jgi:alpha-galactosidase
MEIISNTAIIAVNQDRLGRPASRIWKKSQEAGGDLQLWAGPLADGSVLSLSSSHKYHFSW